MTKYVPGLVSVIIPTYKRSNKLIRAIESVLNQSYNNIELLVVNDNDPNDEYTKDLKKIVSKFNIDNRFKLLMQPKHINGAVARNVGIKYASGEYIAFLDDDDWWKIDKIEKQVNTFSDLDCDYGVISCLIERYTNEDLIARLPAYDNGYVYKDILLLKSDFATGTLLFKHDYLDNAGYFDESLTRHQDLQLLVNFTSKYKLFQIKEYLHCCDVSDGTNRLDSQKLVVAKKKFYKSVQDIINNLSFFERMDIQAINNAEISIVMLRNHQYLDAIKKSILLIFCPRAFYIAIKKIINRKKSYKMRVENERG